MTITKCLAITQFLLILILFINHLLRDLNWIPITILLIPSFMCVVYSDN